MVELADAGDLKSPDRKVMWVRFPLAAQKKYSILEYFFISSREKANLFAFVGNRKAEACFASDDEQNAEPSRGPARQQTR